METLFKKFIEVQLHKIDIDKWYEGTRINRDPGMEYIFKWVDNNASAFREKWERSKCKDCIKYKECGINLLDSCKDYIEMG